MTKCRVSFTKCIQNSQELGSDNEHMVSRVFFDLDIGDQKHPGLYSDIKQVVGSKFETGDIEVGRPLGYKGPFNYTAFRDAVESYYRRLVGSSGVGIRVKGASQVMMMDNTFILPGVAEFEVDDSSPGGW